MSTVGDDRQIPGVARDESWVEESLERYSNPLAYGRPIPAPEPEPVLQEEKVLTSSKSESVKMQVHFVKERLFWSKITLHFTFRLADMEGEDGQTVVVSLVFDTWTGEVTISENAVVKVDELQRPIVGGSWKAKTDYGQVEIKIVPYWTGYQYELWFDDHEVYSLFT